MKHYPLNSLTAGFSNLVGARHKSRLLQAFVPGTFCIPQGCRHQRLDSAPATLQFPPATFFQFENPVTVFLKQLLSTLNYR